MPISFFGTITGGLGPVYSFFYIWVYGKSFISDTIDHYTFFNGPEFGGYVNARNLPNIDKYNNKDVNIGSQNSSGITKVYESGTYFGDIALVKANILYEKTLEQILKENFGVDIKYDEFYKTVNLQSYTEWGDNFKAKIKININNNFNFLFNLPPIVSAHNGKLLIS